MSKRLQVLLNDKEMVEVQRVALSQHLTVAEWVRQVLRKARQEQPVHATAKKIQVVREAARHHYPAGEISAMLDDIARGYLDKGTS